jgi:hypothetical protein
MRSHSDQIRHFFETSGWTEIPPIEDLTECGKMAIYTCEYATVGIVMAPKEGKIIECWADCQVRMSDLRKNPKVGTKKDLYLIFIVEHIDENARLPLQMVTNDTHVCRKICIERSGRMLDEALMDIPFLKIEEQKGERYSEIKSILPEFGGRKFSKQLLKDLATRSANTILDRLLTGKYRGRKSNEN